MMFEEMGRLVAKVDSKKVLVIPDDKSEALQLRDKLLAESDKDDYKNWRIIKKICERFPSLDRSSVFSEAVKQSRMGFIILFAPDHQYTEMLGEVFFQIIEHNMQKTMEILLDSQWIDINCQSKVERFGIVGMSAVMLSAYLDNLKILQELVKRGASLELVDSSGLTVKDHKDWTLSKRMKIFLESDTAKRSPAARKLSFKKEKGLMGW